MKTGLLVRDAMSAEPVSCSSDFNVKKALDMMLEKKVGSLVVKEGEYVKGILTESDLIKKVLYKGRAPEKLLVSDVMTSTVITISPEKDVTDAMKLMADKKVRRLPVVDSGKLVGMLTIKDVVKIQPDLIDMAFRKRTLNEDDDLIGECEECNAKSVSLVQVGGRLLCKDCR